MAANDVSERPSSSRSVTNVATDHVLPPANRVSEQPSSSRSVTNVATDHVLPPAETRIIIMGLTGSGKSLTGNTLLDGDVFLSKLQKQSVTKTCSNATTNVRERFVVVVDTPGFFDTNMSEADIHTEKVRCLGLSSPGPHAVLMTIPVDTRHTTADNAITKAILKMFGHYVEDFVLPVFTKADQLWENSVTEETFMRELDGDLKQVIETCGGKYVFVNNKAIGNERLNEREKIFAEIDKMTTKLEPFYQSNDYKEIERQFLKIEKDFRNDKQDQKSYWQRFRSIFRCCRGMVEDNADILDV